MIERYIERLRNPRAPGTGCHSWIMSTANLGIMSRQDPQQIHDEIRQVMPSGTRLVSDKEITDAIIKALRDYQGGIYTPQPRPAPVVNDGKAALQRILEQGLYNDEVDIWESSPVRIWVEPKDHPLLLLSTLYAPDDLIFIGERHLAGILGDTIRTVSEWEDHFRNGGVTAPHIIPNPLTGIPAPKKGGEGDTLRGDSNIKEYRYCVVEFDDLGREDQIRFWGAASLPIMALIDSGGKSIHAWLQVSKLAEVNTQNDWGEKIKRHLYDRLLTPLGVDAACSNPARLSRLPGHFRKEKQAMQRLIWLSDEGKSVCRKNLKHS